MSSAFVGPLLSEEDLCCHEEKRSRETAGFLELVKLTGRQLLTSSLNDDRKTQARRGRAADRYGRVRALTLYTLHPTPYTLHPTR